MTWEWQQAYEAALRERDPIRLPERLTIAEKVILQRLQELPCPADNNPEGQALREALNRLYAFYPHEHYPPGLIHDEETDPTQRNWMRFALPLGLGLTLASGTAWMAARRSDLNDARKMAAAAEVKALRNSRTTIPNRGDITFTASGDQEHALPSTPAPTTRDLRGVTKNRADGPGIGGETQNSQASFELPVARPNTPATSVAKAPGDTARASDNVANTRGETIKSTEAQQRSVYESAVNEGADPSVQPAEGSQSTLSAATDPPEKSERTRGTVSVSASAYPSLRVPPGQKSEATLSAETLQIGQLISRIDPVYPQDAEREHMEGTVRLRAIVAKDGAVQNVEVMSGPPLLATAAVDALRQWRYNPTLLGNRPIEVTQDFTIVFRLVSAQ